MSARTLSVGNPANNNLHNRITYFNNDPLIPSDLRIVVNTGVPGFQSIFYKPQMSIPDTKEKKVWFNPLVRLNQRIVDKVPPEYRIKQFFNKGLFESLLRYHETIPINEATPKASLEKARKYGNFNNNVNVTLNTLFKTGSVLYIDKKPYVIADKQEINGDWRIDAKPADTDIVTIYNNSANNIYAVEEGKRREVLVNAELANFKGENWIERGVTTYPALETKHSKTAISVAETKPLPLVRRPVEVLDNKQAIIVKNKPVSDNDFEKGKIEVINTPIKPPLLIKEEEKKRPTKEQALIGKYDNLDYNRYFKNDYFGVSRNNSNIRSEFYNIVNELFKTIDDSNKYKQIVSDKILADYTKYTRRKPHRNIETNKFTKTHYIDVVSCMNFYENEGAGNCFFAAVAQAINLHNVNNKNDIIGNKQCANSKDFDYMFFDQGCIRKIVIDSMIHELNDIRDNLDNKDTLEQKDRTTKLTKIIRELGINIPISKFLKLDKDSRNTTITEIQKRVRDEFSKTSYWGTENTMSFFNYGSLRYLGVSLRIVTIRESKKGDEYEIDHDFQNLQKGEKLIFLLNATQGHHKGGGKGEQNHYVLFTLNPLNGYDQSVFSIEDIPFIFLCYIILFLKINDHLAVHSGDETFERDFISQPGVISAIYTANEILMRSGAADNYKKNICSFFHKSDEFCDPGSESGQDMARRVLRNVRKQSSNISKTNSEKLPSRTRYPRSRSKYSSDNSDLNESESETEFDSDAKVKLKKKVSFKEDEKEEDSDEETAGGSYQRQVGGVYPPNTYAGYTNVPVAYPVAKVEEVDKSISSVFTSVELEMHKGTSLSNTELLNSKCNHQYNAIKRSFSILTNRPYVIRPVYGGRKTKRAPTHHAKNKSRRRR
jgi:hypothetical protein